MYYPVYQNDSVSN